MFTERVRRYRPLFLTEIIKAIGTFDDFSDDNDPYSEHDFGTESKSPTNPVGLLLSPDRRILIDRSGNRAGRPERRCLGSKTER